MAPFRIAMEILVVQLLGSACCSPGVPGEIPVIDPSDLFNSFNPFNLAFKKSLRRKKYDTIRKLRRSTAATALGDVLPGSKVMILQAGFVSRIMSIAGNERSFSVDTCMICVGFTTFMIEDSISAPMYRIKPSVLTNKYVALLSDLATL
jgi:hypothetical protein